MNFKPAKLTTNDLVTNTCGGCHKTGKKGDDAMIAHEKDKRTGVLNTVTVCDRQCLAKLMRKIDAEPLEDWLDRQSKIN